jgi:rod shape-determining protein MreC
VYDHKVIRRRRAALGLLVAASLVLLTAFFGGAGGGLSAVQRGVLEVVGPIQEVASGALKPARDLVGWVGDTLDAQGEVDGLRKERDAWRQQAVGLRSAARENAQLRQQLGMLKNNGLADDGPVAARVVTQNPSVWYQQVVIDKGTGDGVRVDQPVVAPGGLVGVVARVTSGTATVSLITDHTTNVSARVNNRAAPTGVVSVAAGNPNDLVLDQLDRDDRVDEGDVVVTRGTVSDTGRLNSLYPPDIPIGRVVRIEDPGTDDQEAHVDPFVDMRRLEHVQVLTKPQVEPTA